jgi:hypothetical protein
VEHEVLFLLYQAQDLGQIEPRQGGRQ